ncbi:MAG: phosphoribosylformylglycinamidine synthase subunit PurS [Acidobacteria bacterium]|nr:phosphoribosylformylglycinamidine synthase subunit PurS [Acidobacteriota bacterium]
MKTLVIVKLKKSVLDPQGETIRRALNKLGYSVQSVRQGKYFELEFDGNSVDPDTVEAISRDVLSNPIIEDFQVQLPVPQSTAETQRADSPKSTRDGKT